MQTRFPLIVLAVSAFAVAAMTPLAGCAGGKARENVLVPAVAASADGLELDARTGVDSLPEAEQAAASDVLDRFMEAVRSADTVQLQTVGVALWPQVESLALAGIEAMLARGEIGPFVAESLRERVRNMGAAISRANRTIAPPLTQQSIPYDHPPPRAA